MRNQFAFQSPSQTTKCLPLQTEKNSAKWAIILFEPNILWELDCAFFVMICNAAGSRSAEIPLSEKNVHYLYSMFKDHLKNIRCSLESPDSYTTSPQAEVLVFDPIPAEYITEIHFETIENFQFMDYIPRRTKLMNIFSNLRTEFFNLE